MLFLTLTGIILWWPRKSSAFRLRRSMPRNASSGELLRSHAASGAIAAIPIIVFAATGAAIVFYTPVIGGAERDVRSSDADEAGCRGGARAPAGEAAERAAVGRAPRSRARDVS